VACVCAQQPDNLLGVCMGQALHVGNATRGQRTGQNHHADFRHTQRCRTGVRRPCKSAGEDADGWHASGFGRYRVVETPRRAGPSIRNTVDNGIALHHQCVDGLIGAGRAVAKLGGVDNFLDLILLLQNFL
jgi:hypothetical protein